MLGFAVAGLLLGHTLSYLLAVPDPSHRDVVLRTTGHAYLPAAAQLAVLLLLAGVAAIVVRSWSGRREAAGERCASLAGLLAGIQATAFVGQEILERLISRSPLSELVHDHVLVTGVGVQILIALIGAALLRWLARTTERIADLVASSAAPPRPALLVPLTVRSGAPRGRLLPGGPSVRAPPSP